MPIVALALVGGALADAFDRRRLVAVAELGAGRRGAALLVVNALLPDPHLWVLYVARGAARRPSRALLRPPLDALVPRLVERDELKAATAIEFGAVRNAAAIGGPGARRRADRAAGPAGDLRASTSRRSLVSLGALRAMRTPPPPPDAEPPSLRAIAEGVRYARARARS